MKLIKQLSLAEMGFQSKAGKQTRKVVFLAEMETIVPWSGQEALIEPHYPKKGNGRPPMPLSTMLRIHFMQQWFGYSDPAMEEALHDVQLLRGFAGSDVFEDVMPDESKILRFRHLLKKHDLAVAIFAEVNAVLSEKGLSMKCGTVVDATLIAAPSSTKNEDKKCDPEMMQTKKGNQWRFGMKAHIGADAESGLVHTVECTTAKVADITMMESCLHGGKSSPSVIVVAIARRIELSTTSRRKVICVRPDSDQEADGWCVEQRAEGFQPRMLSAVRTIVEHPFRVVERQVGFVKVRYRGLAKNTRQIVTLALANLWLARKRLLPLVSEVHP